MIAFEENRLEPVQRLVQQQIDDSFRSFATIDVIAQVNNEVASLRRRGGILPDKAMKAAQEIGTPMDVPDRVNTGVGRRFSGRD